MNTVRFGVLTISVVDTMGQPHSGYVIFDRATSRIVDGVYFRKELALEVAACNIIRNAPPQDMTPTAGALGLEFPSDDTLRHYAPPLWPDAQADEEDT
jgi:hypothetical protein